MKDSFFLKFTFCIFTLAIFMTSCSKEENKEIIEEQVIETVEPILLITINGVTNEYNAYASYCNDNGKEFLQVSNNQLLLDTTLIVENFQVDDFLLFYTSDGENEFALGGATFEDDFNGTPITSVILDAEAAEITIDEITSEYAKGSMTGEFTLLNGNTAPYSVEFTAEIVEVSPWCQ